MTSPLDSALKQVGVDLGNDASTNLIGAIGAFNQQNLSPSDLALANSGLSILSTATGIGKISPGAVVQGKSGEWDALSYAGDLNQHHPKFKFLFKVNFNGFPGGNFSYFVHRCDKPKVRFNHTEVNYYNFRTKVLTSTTFDPLTFTFLDEIGNTVNAFFVQYMAARSMQGAGKASINGGAEYSSTVPYKNGYSGDQPNGTTVQIQQVFANGLASNIFTLVNARIDALEFDELSMEQTAGSMMTCTVSYDAITCTTIGGGAEAPGQLVNHWGNNDLYGASYSIIPPDGPASSASGSTIGGASSFLTDQSQQSFDQVIDGVSNINTLPNSLADLAVPDSLAPIDPTGIAPISSSSDVLSNDINTSINSIYSIPHFGPGLNPNIDDATRASAASWVAQMNHESYNAAADGLIGGPNNLPYQPASNPGGG